MFKSLVNLETSWQRTRIMFFAFIAFCTLIVIYVCYYAFSTINQHAQTIYVLDQGSVIAAKAQNIQENRPVEAREHVKRFHEYFFTLSPDEKAITNHISRALYLADNSAKIQYDNLKESGYYNGIIAGNISQHIRVDTVMLKEGTYPFQVRIVAKMEILRPSSITLRNLVATCTLRDVARSDNNPHGFLIEGWQVLENSDIKTINR
ncbi:conjugative transposon protein TraK [Cytophagaceae bacterium DM2B3-1]|uniref:Conjugative transposon protein TraK n=1 Tax=Xanthocytophaga flava TaxID=3048013 RepID=A0ABT7CXD4_9BACT|nr:conjugative transposon protein TraK [Xanthocytophaga flavus]MDJ1497602.1 conjugative transposon protein TraK [Xanthocytophaga flavus]